MITPTGVNAESAQTVFQTGCCPPPFDPSLWEGKETEWRSKPFLRARARALFHVPVNIGSVISRARSTIERAGAAPPQPLMLSDDESPWRSDLLLEVSKAIPGAEMDYLSGTFMTKVFEGPYRDAGKWMKAMTRYVAERGRKLERLYLGYTVCPACAKAYGKNQVVLFAKVGES